MYLRLRNLVDIEACAALFEQSHRMPLYEAIKEDLTLLDDAYGAERRAFDMGGYVLYFPTMHDFSLSEKKLYQAYNLDSEMYESNDIIWKDEETGIAWRRKLFLRSSDDALVLIYPEAIIGKTGKG